MGRRSYAHITSLFDNWICFLIAEEVPLLKMEQQWSFPSWTNCTQCINVVSNQMLEKIKCEFFRLNYIPIHHIRIQISETVCQMVDWQLRLLFHCFEIIPSKGLRFLISAEVLTIVISCSTKWSCDWINKMKILCIKKKVWSSWSFILWGQIKLCFLA